MTKPWLFTGCLLLAFSEAAMAEHGSTSGPTDRHWSFAVPLRAEPPAVHRVDWVRTPVDRFILARLESEKIRPSPEADRSTILRRLYLDLLGLPPSPEEVAAFVADRSPDAYERRVDELLSSPHFGERWGRHWLDLARYADSSGYQVDRERPWAWVYRDWVIRSFNDDQPFDEFTLWQLAGDLVAESLPERSRRDALIAAGFHRMTLSNHEDGVDAAEFAARAQVDRVATTGLVWLGLTLGCAECHSHKYDPISQREFYQLYAFFDAAEERDLDLGAGLTAYTFAPRKETPKTFVHVRGDFLRHGEQVQPAFLKAIRTTHPATEAPAGLSRLDLARWVVAAENPLTARVAVNQIWLHLFGRGLVATTEDFGTRGEAPSHPALLDWLATEFPSQGWSRKAMIRLIVTSATYRQSSRTRPELRERDPDNRWISRQSRFRLEAEVLRDASLEVGGQLNRRVGGPSFRPLMPPDVKWLGTAGAWTWTDDSGPVLWRRSLYSYAQRTVPHPLLATFDQANASEACTRRERANTPLQALTLLNNDTFVQAARALAARIELEVPGRASDQIEHAFQICLGRTPVRAERHRLEQLLEAMPQETASDRLFVLAQTLLSLDEFQNRE